MEIIIQCGDGSSGAEDELRSLGQWLEADSAVRRHVQVVPGTARSAMPGQQGDLLDLITLVVSSGFSAASLAVSIASWRASRPGPSAALVMRTEGEQAEIPGDASGEEAEARARRFLEG
ncbi:hypothetical protein OG887_12605 [Streptomyces sp. NBC_00053]|uniref:effector-associated constant component EACC1 n=1 Tax=unclassified Streptomyces TaxID=2593676 RepID=UPI000F5BB915|nr:MULTISPECIES: hypothetical protein [unclassified Streptomyces]MCX5500215.1 hypothetical protein [Streptomyces sp. NBC_00052]MCX5551249.1 hypothetical protein [Streptomyces sp. NBC_00051]WSG50550.1 hypothetical protein OHA38_12470 [Streptomyces sp. NBC_01732]WSX01206.1 hypothetical protein OG355_12605 [Streptomyces sp. NBC_00987]